jgi:two-component system, NtrC family, sensor kinase
MARTLEDIEGRLRLLSAHTEGILFELDEQARFVRVWTSDPKLLARPERELLGKTVLEALGPELGLQHHEAALETVRSGKPAHYEYELDVPSGRRHFACESVAVPSCREHERHAVFWIRDTTEQMQLQARMVEIERLATVGTLAAGVAHEINNPLAYMTLNVERLRKAFRTCADAILPQSELEELMDCVDMIDEGARRVKRIVHDLQQLARPDEPVEPTSLSEVLELAAELSRPVCESRARLIMQWQKAPRVLAHRGRLVQVFGQLLTNAAEAIPEGKAEENTITISVRPGAPGNVLVEISDTGTGVAEDAVSRLFEPFFTTKEQGTGLGLTITQRIVNSFNGGICYEPREGRGSIFRVTLPVTP